MRRTCLHIVLNSVYNELCCNKQQRASEYIKQVVVFLNVFSILIHIKFNDVTYVQSIDAIYAESFSHFFHSTLCNWTRTNWIFISIWFYQSLWTIFSVNRVKFKRESLFEIQRTHERKKKQIQHRLLRVLSRICLPFTSSDKKGRKKYAGKSALKTFDFHKYPLSWSVAYARVLDNVRWRTFTLGIGVSV